MSDRTERMERYYEEFTDTVREQFLGRSFYKQGWFVSTGSSWLSWLSAMAEFGSTDSLNYAHSDNQLNNQPIQFLFSL